MTGRAKRLLFALFLVVAGACAGAAPGVMLYTPSTTLSRFEASASSEDGLVRVRWQTTVELGVEAFRVMRQRNGGAWESVGFVRSQGNEEGAVYELADPLVQAGDPVRYELLIASPGVPDQHVADWAGTVKKEPPSIQIQSVAVPPSQGGAAPAGAAQVWIGSGARVRLWTNSVPADRVRLSLREEGVYRVSAQELADASGWEVSGVSDAINTTNLSLSCQGLPVAWSADGDNLLFYGVPAESRFAPENVYWVARETGVAMVSQVMTPPVPAITNGCFVNRITHQGTDYLARVSYSTLADAPAPYIAFAGPILSGSSKSYAEALPDCATGLWAGVVTVNLLSYYEVDTDDHAVRVSVGGTPLGTPSWSSEQYVSFTYPFSSTNITGGTATLNVVNIGTAPPVPATDSTRFLCMSYGFSYPKQYRARNGGLRCTGGAGNTVAVSGFASNDVAVLDVTVTNHPCVVSPVTITYDSASNTWTAAFPCGGSGQVYQVFSKSAGTLQPAVRGVGDVDWSLPTNSADYVILIPPEAWRGDFRAVLQPLADYRAAHGLTARIVDVESLYNRYSYGLVDPLAIRAFCADGVTNWAGHPLRYVLLAGAGALDFKQQRLSVNDYTACLIPTLIAGQRFSTGEGMTVAIDAALGDVNEDGVPEVAIGRLPTTKTQDLAVVVQKTIAYEDGLRWQRPVSVAADWDNVGSKAYPFSTGTDRLIEPLEKDGRTTVKHYPIDDTGNLTPVKIGSLFPALSAGAGLFHFFGHTDEQNLGGGSGKLLSNGDVTSNNWKKATILVVMGCRPNRWQSLTTTTCLIPYGLFSADAGFVAGLGATGYMLGDEGENLAVNLYSVGNVPGLLRMGDVWRRGLQLMAGAMPPERLHCYSLIGDPALVFNEDNGPYTLTATAVNGTVTRTPDATNYDNNASVTLTAVPEAGYYFTGWSGDATGTNNPVSVIVTQNMSVTAGFAMNLITVLVDHASISVPEGGLTNFQVKLSAQPTGDTVVAVARTSGDTDITVSEGALLTFSTTNWAAFQSVTLAAAEDNADNSNGLASITCHGDGWVDAAVEAVERDDDYSLIVTAVTGVVAKDPDSAFYDNGMGVTLIASANTGRHFAGWSGDVSGSTNPVVITMDADKQVVASFALNVITVLTDRASVSVPEGGSTNIRVRLSAQPTGDTVVAVARTSGDTDITVSGGANLSFSTVNWPVYQSVTLTAAEDNSDNVNGGATITFQGVGVTPATVEAVEMDDDYTLTATAVNGVVTKTPDLPYYDRGTKVVLTVLPRPLYFFAGWTGSLTGTNNPVYVRVNANKSVTAHCAAPLVVLPPRAIGSKSFTARWKWAEDGAPEGELSVASGIGFTPLVPGYESRYIVNVAECVVTNLIAGRDYWYRIRRRMPDGSVSPWFSAMKVKTGKGMPAFSRLLSEGPVSKGVSQAFIITNLMSGSGVFSVKSSNTNAVNVGLMDGTMKLQYVWKGASHATVTMTLSRPETGYKVSYGTALSRAYGSVAIIATSRVVNAGARVTQDLILENRTGGLVYGVRVRALGLDQATWLINRTGLDPVSGAAIRELPCVLPTGAQVVVRLVYNLAYQAQAKARPVAYEAWAVMTPVEGAFPVNRAMAISQKVLYDGLWLLGFPANRNRLYSVEYSDNGGAVWTLSASGLRATANYLLWLDLDEGASTQRLYRVRDVGL